jgi:hypothetical protein
VCNILSDPEPEAISETGVIVGNSSQNGFRGLVTIQNIGRLAGHLIWRTYAKQDASVADNFFIVLTLRFVVLAKHRFDPLLDVRLAM